MIYYYLGILKKFSFNKGINFLKLFFGFHLSRIIHKPLQFGLPFFISVEPTTSCNFRCPQCPSGLRSFTRETGMLNPEFFEKIIFQMKSHLHTLTFYFQGEPFLNPSFLKMVGIANSYNIYTSTSTNAHYLNEEIARQTVLCKLDKMIISIDGTTQESYEKYRVGGDIEKVIDGTKNILKQKKILNSRTPHVVWQFVVFRHNEHQIEQARELSKQLGLDGKLIQAEMMKGDYENLINVFDKHFGEFVTLYR